MHNQYGWDFALFSANLNYFMPELGWQAHAALYEKWRDYHRPKSIRTLAHWDVSCLEQLKTQPASILCLYHLGYHAQIPRILADHNILYDMILDRRVFEARREDLIAMQTAMKRRGMTYRFLFSEDPQVLLQARSALRQGRHLLVFADGHSGTTDKQNRVRIDFMASQIAVRKGIALLSYLLRAAIVPISHAPATAGIRLYAGTPIHPESGADREFYMVSAMRSLYRFLEQELYRAPYLWESWNYLQDLDCFDILPQYTVDDGEDGVAADASIPLTLQGISGRFDRINYRFISG
jgi:lauroyl/myristoyl acyltransferase